MKAPIPLILASLLFAAMCLAPNSQAGIPLREDDGFIVKWYLDTPGQANVVDGKLTFHLDPRGSLDVPSFGNELQAVHRAFENWERKIA